MAVDQDGTLRIHTHEGGLKESPPMVYATRKGTRSLVQGRFVLIGPTEYGFHVDAPADTDELLIDPTLAFSTYLGTTDYATAMEVDSAGNIYVTGTTFAPGDFPVTNNFTAAGAGPSRLSVFATKLSPDGARLIYSTLLANAWNGFQGTYQSTPAPNSSHVLALNAAGEVYVTGFARAGFPSTPNAFQQCSGGEQHFISKLNSSGDQLLYSSCLASSISSGGGRFESIALNGSEEVYMVGTVNCGALSVTQGAYQSTCTATGGDLYA